MDIVARDTVFAEGAVYRRSPVENETMNLVIQHILELCQPDDVLKYMGSHHGDHSLEHVSMKKEMEERKEAIIDCMLARAHRVADGFLKDRKDCPPIFRKFLGPVFGVAQQSKAQADEGSKKPKEEDDSKAEDVSTAVDEDSETFTLQDVQRAYHDLLTWVSSDDVKVLLLVAKYSVACNHLGKAAVCLQKLIDDMRANGKDASVIESALIEVCEKMGWIHITTRLKNDRLVRNRSTYRPF
ncbi:hypothetical protein GCK32_015102 [Trichostrongylus colubriformis]|uniref:Uncharacterized protein n=1 Tax=Trichostrongylus colubriformis TaxID=6319 RepID=A0AAN8FEB9_TRICO